MKRSPAGERRVVWIPAALVFVTLFALCTRLLQARESLWLDELHTAWTATGPWAAVVARSAMGNQSPLFFALEWLLTRVFGAGELVLRIPSLIAGVLLPIALYALVRAWTRSAWLGLLPAWLVALDPQAAYFGTEARPYALVQLGAVLHVWLFVTLTDRPTLWKRVGFIGGAAFLFHLHYTTVLLLAAEAIWYLATRRGRQGSYRLTSLAVDLAAVAILALPAAPIISGIFARRDNWRVFVGRPPLWVGVLMLPWCAFALSLMLLVTAWRGAQRDSSRRDVPSPVPGAAVVVCWLTVPLCLAWLATTTDVARLLTPRYIAASAPAALVLLALAINGIPARRVRLLAGAAFALAGTVASPALRYLVADGRLIDWRTDDWRGAVAWFNQQPRHDKGIVLLRSLLIESDGLRAHPRDSALIAYSRYPLTSLYRIEPPDRVAPLPRTDPEREIRTLPPFRGDSTNWLVFQGDLASARIAELDVLDRLLKTTGRAWRIDAQAAFGTVHVARFELVSSLLSLTRCGSAVNTRCIRRSPGPRRSSAT